MGDVHGFRRTLTGRIVLDADEVERGLLVDLVSQLHDLVAPDEDPWGADADPLARLVGIDPSAERPDDPALARLFPDAYTDDDEAAAEFRRFTQRSLVDLKMTHATTVLERITSSEKRIEVPREETGAWLGALNDLRLALGTRMGLTEEDHEALLDVAEDDPRYVLIHVYDWLTFLQETLVQAVSGLVSEPPRGVVDDGS